MKHSEKNLSEHPLVIKIIDSKTVRCKCGKNIRLDRKWDPDLLERYNKGGGCKYNNGLLGITNFFKENDNKTNKRKICEGLIDEETKNYLKCVGLITSFGGAPHVELHLTAFKIYKTLTDKKILLSILHCLNV